MLTEGAKVVAYSALRKKLKRPHIKIVTLLEKNPQADIWEMEFPVEHLGEACFDIFMDDIQTVLTNPKSKVTVWFKGGQKRCGLVPFKWYVMVNNRIFVRLTYKDVGKMGAKCGLWALRDKKSIIYITPIKINKKDKMAIMESINHQLCEEKV